MRIAGSSAMSTDVLWTASGPALEWRNHLSLRLAPATSLLSQNWAKLGRAGDRWGAMSGGRQLR